MRVVFGHQSVGQNLLEGLRELATAGPDAAPRIAAFRVGRNGDARSKLAHFEETAQRDEALGADLVLFKFCYVDVDARTDLASLFGDYRRTVDAVRRQRDGRVVGQVTVPLRTLSSGFVARLRHRLGRHHPQLLHNAARDRFNALLRREYGASGTLFDLAAVESGEGEGARRVPGPQGPVCALRPEYSDDGGHLGPRGRRVVARAFLGYLERLRPAAGGAVAAGRAGA